MANVSLMCLVTTVLLLNSCEAFKILVAFPFPSTSHGILGDGVVRHLLAAGHEVTYITPFPKKDPHPKLRQVDVSSNKKDLILNVLNIKGLMDKEVDLKDQNFIFNMMIGVAKAALEHEHVQKLIHDPKQRFDVIIAEWMFTDVYTGFAAVFDCPFIWFFPFEHFSVILSLIDVVPNPAYTPTLQSSSIPPFSFKQRVEGLISHILSMVSRFTYLKVEMKIYDKNFASILAKKGRPLPSFDEIRHNISLALVNSHVSLGHPMRTPPNYINIGGYHIETDVKPLPGNLKKIMDGAQNGVIYFSLGSNLQSKELPNELKRDLLKIFGELKQTVLWKFEEVLPDLPRNVHILQWAPQPSILSHPNCILFITHGGLLSTTETVHFGVPVIGIPVFADQFLNVDKVVAKGFAKRVDLSYTMANELKVAIEDIISDTRYAKKAKEVSLVYHDRVVAPGKELVHWVEHVVRTGGAPHLCSPALHVPWYQRIYLDLLALTLTVLVLLKAAMQVIFPSNVKKDGRKKRKNN